MKLKQKLTLLTAFMSLILGFSLGGFSVSVSAQQSYELCPEGSISCGPDGNLDETVNDLPDCSSIEDEDKLKACEEAVTKNMAADKDPYACDEGEKSCCGGVKTSIISGSVFCGKKGSTDVQESTIWRLLIAALNILTAGVGIAAVGGIVYGALLYTAAQNNSEQTKRAIGIITNVVIGLVAYALMYIILNFLIPGGIFS